MAEGKKIKADSAEQAYAAAAAEQPLAGPVKKADVAESPVVPDQAIASTPVEDVTFPPKAKRGRKPTAMPQGGTPASSPVEAQAEPAAPAVPEIVTPDAVEPPSVVAAVKPKTPRKSAPLAKPMIKRVAAKPLPAPAPVKSLMKRKIKLERRPAETKSNTVPSLPSLPKVSQPNVIHSNIKDTVMDMSSNFTDSFKGIVVEAQEKAKEAFSKSNAMVGEYNEFAKGNVDAVVESGKILAAGLQDMGTNLVAESRSAFETMTADLKEMSTVKSPADFFRLQSDFVRRSFDSAVAYGSKNTEAMLKLASEVAAPLSGRVSVAVEKVRQPMM